MPSWTQSFGILRTLCGLRGRAVARPLQLSRLLRVSSRRSDHGPAMTCPAPRKLPLACGFTCLLALGAVGCLRSSDCPVTARRRRSR